MTRIGARVQLPSKAEPPSMVVGSRLGRVVGLLRRRAVVLADAALVVVAVWTVLLRFGVMHDAAGAVGIDGYTITIPGVRLLALLLLARLSITPGWVASFRLHRQSPIWSFVSLGLAVILGAGAVHALRSNAGPIEPFFPDGSAPYQWPYNISSADHDTIREGCVRLYRATPEYLAGTTWPRQGRSLETYPYLKVGCEDVVVRVPGTKVKDGFDVFYSYINWQSAFAPGAFLPLAEATPASVVIRMRGASSEDAAWETVAQADIEPRTLWWRWFEALPEERRWLQWTPLHVQSESLLDEEVDIEISATGVGARHVIVADTDPLLDRPKTAIPSTAPRRIILVSLDTLAADHVSHLGYRRATTPNLDRFAEQGVIFESAFAAAPWTSPSHWSMLTGLTPSFHGVYPERTGRTRPYESVVTLAESLRHAGYHTAAITGGYAVSSDWGFHRGFDLFHSTWQCLPPTIHLQVPIRDYRKDAAVNMLHAIRYIREHKTEPFFLFLHTYEPHAPGLRVHDFKDDDGLLRENTETGEPSFPNLAARLALSYDSDIRCTDQWLGKLLDTLKQENLLDDALVIVTSDHGETFRPTELGLPQPGRCHGYSLYDDELHVPLVMRFPRSLGIPSTRIAAPVSLVDLCPTILECVGILNPAQSDVPKLGQGQSLLGIARIPSSADLNRVILAEGSTGSPSRIALRNGMYKFVRLLPAESDAQAKVTERLAAWSEDRLERVNIIETHPELAAEFGGQAQAYEEAVRQYSEIHGDEQAVAGPNSWKARVNDQQLRSIGYVD